MRLLHPKTLEIAATRDDIPKTVISHCWSEIFKWKASNKPHPKQFIDNDYYLGKYLCWLYTISIECCNLDSEKIHNLNIDIVDSFFEGVSNHHYIELREKYFNDNYLFSDACSLYYKGINIFPDIFGDEWRKYVPVESHKEILRQVTKTLNNK